MINQTVVCLTVRKHALLKFDLTDSTFFPRYFENICEITKEKEKEKEVLADIIVIGAILPHSLFS